RADRGQSRSVHDSLRSLRSDRATPSAPARWALPSSAPLTGHARRDFRQDPESCRCDPITTDLADAIRTVSEAVERLGQTIGSLDESTADGPAQFPLLANACGVAAPVSSLLG